MLVVAGSLKRGDRGRPEDQVLMRALRDFNIPKIVTDDMPVFMGLIGDLFPALDVPRKRDLDFEKYVKQSIVVCTSQIFHTIQYIIVCIIGIRSTTRGQFCTEGSTVGGVVEC